MLLLGIAKQNIFIYIEEESPPDINTYITLKSKNIVYQGRVRQCFADLECTKSFHIILDPPVSQYIIEKALKEKISLSCQNKHSTIYTQGVEMAELLNDLSYPKHIPLFLQHFKTKREQLPTAMQIAYTYELIYLSKTINNKEIRDLKNFCLEAIVWNES